MTPSYSPDGGRTQAFLGRGAGDDDREGARFDVAALDIDEAVGAEKGPQAAAPKELPAVPIMLVAGEPLDGPHEKRSYPGLGVPGILEIDGDEFSSGAERPASFLDDRTPQLLAFIVEAERDADRANRTSLEGQASRVAANERHAGRPSCSVPDEAEVPIEADGEIALMPVRSAGIIMIEDRPI